MMIHSDLARSARKVAAPSEPRAATWPTTMRAFWAGTGMQVQQRAQSSPLTPLPSPPFQARAASISGPRRARSPPPPPPLAPPLAASNELRLSGSKSEPPSRPSVDWSRKRPHFGQDMARNVSVELGKTAYLTCKVYELGDKTVSLERKWLLARRACLQLGG